MELHTLPRLQCSPERDSHRFWRTEGQGISERNTDEIEIRAGAGHRLYLLHRWRRGGIRRVGRSIAIVPRPHHQTDKDGGATTVPFRQGVWLLRIERFPLPCFHQRGNGVGTDACNRYSAAVLQLRRIIAMGIHDSPFHLPENRCGKEYAEITFNDIRKQNDRLQLSAQSVIICFNQNRSLCFNPKRSLGLAWILIYSEERILFILKFHIRLSIISSLSSRRCLTHRSACCAR